MKFSLKDTVKLEKMWNYSDLIAIRLCRLSEDNYIIIKSNFGDIFGYNRIVPKETFVKMNSIAKSQIILSDIYLQNTELLLEELDSIKNWDSCICNSPSKYDFKNLFAIQTVIFIADLIAIKMENDTGYYIKKCVNNPELMDKIIPFNEFRALNYRASNQIILDASYINVDSFC